MEINIVFVGAQNTAKLKELLKDGSVSFAECGNVNQFKMLLKKNHVNHVFLSKAPSDDELMVVLRDTALFGARCRIYTIVHGADNEFVFKDALGNGDSKSYDLGTDIQSFLSLLN